jgi:hypothetical protein
VNVLLELTLIILVWLGWTVPAARSWIIAALLIHLATRAWSFAYFIPAALKFERLEATTPELDGAIAKWVSLSRWRIVLGIGSLLALAVAITKLLQ